MTSLPKVSDLLRRRQKVLLTMGDNPNLRLELLFKSVKDLQQEKTCLEQKLRELRNLKAGTEKTLDAVTSKRNQVKEINSKMLETLKVAQHKVTQTQCQMNSLENIHQEKKRDLIALNRKVEEEKKHQLDEISDFESKLSQLSVQLLGAKDFYSPSNLQTESAQVTADWRQLMVEIGACERQLEDLNRQLEIIQIGKEESQPELPGAVQKVILDLFEQEFHAASGRAEKLVSHKECLQTKLHQDIGVA